jgi:2,3-bisphosphoglycerate-independent phosphoglycerate mutase
MNEISTPRRPVVLVILDGFGVNPGKSNNAIAQADTPVLDAYFANYPHTTLLASGRAVGLPDGQMGNSEVGHLILGCGNVVRQNLVLIDDAIESGEFDRNPAFLDAIEAALANNRPLHLLGLVSDGGVHSHLNHLIALIKLCKKHCVKPLLHMVTDGRDTPPRSALHYLDEIEPLLAEAGGAVASIMGRYYAMDRDNRWERTRSAWQAIVAGKGRMAISAHAAIESAYAMEQNDEFIEPVVISNAADFEDGDQLISFNFRKDRLRQIMPALGKADFDHFERGHVKLAKVTCMMPYDNSFDYASAFLPDRPPVTLAEVISKAGMKQLHCAETEKYAHVTYFFNGGHSEPYPGETQTLIPSPKVATYDLKPEMSAMEIAATVVEAIQAREYDFILVNFANGDMVGHTAVMPAIVKAVEALDQAAGQVLDAAGKAGYSVVLTADHGNCEEVIDAGTGTAQTQHTTYPVPCLVVDEQVWQLSCNGSLATIAATVLQLMGIDIPASISGESLLLKARTVNSHYQHMLGVA